MLLGAPGYIPNALQVFAAVSWHDHVETGSAYLADELIFHPPFFAVRALLHEDFVHQHTQLLRASELLTGRNGVLFAQANLLHANNKRQTLIPRRSFIC